MRRRRSWMPSWLFDTEKATLKLGAYATVDRVAQALQQSSERKVMIEGCAAGTKSGQYPVHGGMHRVFPRGCLAERVVVQLEANRKDPNKAPTRSHGTH
jgi:hypothetical protein